MERIRDRARAGSRGPPPEAWAIAALALLMVVLVSRQQGSGFPTWATVRVEGTLPDSVLVDLRWRSRSGQVEGPIVQTLAPDSDVHFRVRNDRAFCLRVITLPGGRVSSINVEPTEDVTTMTIRLDEAVLYNQPGEALRCERDAAAHRVRVGVGRYFEPGRPERIRRERIVWR